MNDKLSLTELQLLIKDSLHLALPGMFWIVAEISEIKENYSGHCYLELVEKHPDETSIRARAKAVIWAKKYSFLKPFFEQATGESLKEGFKVLLKITVEYHEVYGLSLVINDIDPAFTIGEMAVKRNQIIRRLEEEGVFSMNKELDFPILPKRIAVISSKNAAGYNDFHNHLTCNSYGYTFQTVLFDALMQGKETENSVIDALNRISEHIGMFDTVVIIRGGGAQADLSWFDNYRIAYHITQFPLPVLTGIGHEKDVTVADLVAYQCLKTPTAVADYIITMMSETESYLSGLSDSISQLSLQVIVDSRNRLDKSRMTIILLAGQRMADEKGKLSGRIISMLNSGKEYLIRKELIPANLTSRMNSGINVYSSVKGKRVSELLTGLKMITGNHFISSQRRVDTLSNHLKIIDPENVLKRGFTITSRNGYIVKSAGILNEGDVIDTKFSDGSVKSRLCKS